MTDRDDILRMAREAGLRVGTNLSGITLIGGKASDSSLLVHLSSEDLCIFASMVANTYAAKAEAKCDFLLAALDKYRGQLDRFGVHSAADAIDAVRKE